MTLRVYEGGRHQGGLGKLFLGMVRPVEWVCLVDLISQGIKYLWDLGRDKARLGQVDGEGRSSG